MEDLVGHIHDEFQRTLGHGLYTGNCWTATVGFNEISFARLLPLCLSSCLLSTRQLLMVLNFLKEYRVEAAACVVFGYKSPSTYETHVWEGLEHLDELLHDVRLHTCDLKRGFEIYWSDIL